MYSILWEKKSLEDMSTRYLDFLLLKIKITYKTQSSFSALLSGRARSFLCGSIKYSKTPLLMVFNEKIVSEMVLYFAAI